MSKFEKECDRNVICPYCGKEDKDSWEIHMDDDETKEHECGWCEKKFHLSCSISRLLTTAPDCELNGAEHKWTLAEEANDALNLRNYDTCDVCGEMRFVSDRKKLTAPAIAYRSPLGKVVVFNGLGQEVEIIPAGSEAEVWLEWRRIASDIRIIENAEWVDERDENDLYGDGEDGTVIKETT